MQWIEAKVTFHHTEPELATDLIADIFYDFEIQGVVIEDPDIEPDNGWAEVAVVRPGSHAVVGYFAKDRRTEKKCKLLAQKLDRLKNNLGLAYQISYKERDDEDWAQAWKAFFWPQRIGKKVIVKPTWREYSGESDDMVVELDPGMAFGTGTHPTTALCIEMIETHLKPGDTFLDVGAGSGILMIVASKLGAQRVCGVDKDQIAVDIATENLMRNGLNPERFSVITGNLVDQTESRYDFIVANILTYVILDLLESITTALKADGIFVCSGILEENQDVVVAKMKEIGFNILEVAMKEQWIAIAGRFHL